MPEFRFFLPSLVTVRSRLRCALLFVLASLWSHQMLPACSVPVFRYGFEHWTADPYRVQIVHYGGLDAEAQRLANELKEAAARANISVQIHDATKAKGPGRGPFPRPKPWMMVYAPSSARVQEVVWSGEFDKASITALLDSPARQDIATRLGEGESSVFVLLESGEKTADDAAASLLEARLEYLTSVMELPKLDEQDVRNGLVSLPPDGLRLSFSVVRVSRSDPAESFFTQMLLATEPDLKDISGPIAFPVFGQGRALYALVGKGIRHETIDDAASFLIGSCSCQVKEKNPGTDLLMSVDWKGLLQNQTMQLQDLPTAKEIVGSLPDMPETVTIQSRTDAGATATAADHAAPSTNGKLIAVGAALGILSVIAGIGVFASRKRKV